MADREVRIGLASFRKADSPDDTEMWGFGLLGEVVDVHLDDVERFDRLNGPAPTVAPPLPEPVDSGEDEDEPLEVARPAGNASLEDWQGFALASGASEADLDGLSRNDLRDLYGK